MAKWHMASSGDAIPKLLGRLVDLAIRAILFVVGVTIAAYWCDVQPTWKLFAFMGFWAFWSRTVFGAKGEWGKPEVQPAVIARKVEVMTPAQVAAEARKTTRAVRMPWGRSPPGSDGRS